MEALRGSKNTGAASPQSVVELLVAETVLAAERSLRCFILAVGSISSQTGPRNEGSEVILGILRRSKPEAVPENKDDGESDDDNDEDGDSQEDGGKDDFSGEEGNDNEGENDDPEVNGGGGSEEEDEEDDEEDDDEEEDEDEEEDDEDEDEELPQPPSKKSK
ncbi:unnamed protein product [Musa hybrid cultivar]